MFADPDRFDVRRANARRHLAFAHGPHVCLGMHLARLEAHAAVGGVLERLPGLRLDPERPAAPAGSSSASRQRFTPTWTGRLRSADTVGEVTDALIVDAVRSPIGRRNGALASVRADDLAAAVLNALVARRVDPVRDR